MPETALQQTLAELRTSLDDATAKLETQEGISRTQHTLITRLRIFFWLGVCGAVIFAIAFGLIYRESQTRVDQIQESRLSGCVATEAAKRALIERDVELVNIAVQVAEGEPELATAIIDRLNSGVSAEALMPLDCEDVINGE